MSEKAARVTDQEMMDELEKLNYTIDERFDYILMMTDLMHCNLVNSQYDSALENAIDIMTQINIMRMEDSDEK
jgi:hypothetical protein